MFQSQIDEQLASKEVNALSLIDSELVAYGLIDNLFNVGKKIAGPILRVLKQTGIGDALLGILAQKAKASIGKSVGNEALREALMHGVDISHQQSLKKLKGGKIAQKDNIFDKIQKLGAVLDQQSIKSQPKKKGGKVKEKKMKVKDLLAMPLNL